MDTTVENIFKTLISDNIGKNSTFTQLINNYSHLFHEGKYIELYKNLAGYLAHADLDKFTYELLSKSLDILESKCI